MNKDKVNEIVKKSELLSGFKLYYFRIKWRSLNRHNLTTAASCFNARKVTIGDNTYGPLNVKHFGNPNESLSIGNYCSIGQACTFLLGGDHVMDRISTYPFKTKFRISEYESVTKREIVVGDDVWIGYGSTILSGVHIGQGAVVAAGSMVTNDIPPYAIVGGVPAKIIKYRLKNSMKR